MEEATGWRQASRTPGSEASRCARSTMFRYGSETRCDIFAWSISNLVTFEGMPAEEERTLNRNSLAYDDELRASGHYIASNALQSVQSAVTVRVRNKRISTSEARSPRPRSIWAGSS